MATGACLPKFTPRRCPSPIEFCRLQGRILIDQIVQLCILMKPLPGSPELLQSQTLMGRAMLPARMIARRNGVISFIRKIPFVIRLRHFFFSQPDARLSTSQYRHSSGLRISSYRDSTDRRSLSSFSHGGIFPPMRSFSVDRHPISDFRHYWIFLPYSDQDARTQYNDCRQLPHPDLSRHSTQSRSDSCDADRNMPRQPPNSHPQEHTDDEPLECSADGQRETEQRP